LVQKWKATTFWLDDKELDWWIAFIVPRCIQGRLRAYESSGHCGRNNYWGCHKLPNGLTAGQLDENGAFHVDRERFLFEYKEWLEVLSACPFFDRELVLRKLEELDKVIDPRTSDHWDYYRGHGVPSGRIRGVVFVPDGRREADFATLEERGEKAWRTRIIAIPNERWLELSEEGHIPEVDVLLEQGWYLVSLAEHGGVWYCVLQRA
jgi:hypothetical protein